MSQSDENLSKFFSFQHFVGAGKQFLICIDLRQHMNKNSLNGAKHLTPMNVAACLIMQTLRCESSPICLAYSVPGLVPVDVQNKHTYEEVLKRLSEVRKLFDFKHFFDRDAFDFGRFF